MPYYKDLGSILDVHSGHYRSQRIVAGGGNLVAGRSNDNSSVLGKAESGTQETSETGINTADDDKAFSGGIEEPRIP